MALRSTRWGVATGLALLGAAAYYQRETVARLILEHDQDKTRPAHHEPNGKGFLNPWPSFVRHGHFQALRMMLQFDRKQVNSSQVTQVAKIQNLNKDLVATHSEPAAKSDDGHNKIAYTWLGHACFLVQIDGVNILFDPVFSDRCSPSQYVGPKRVTPPPCKLDELPRIDIVVISHNHYDHLDLATIQNLQKQHQPYFYVPLGNKTWFDSIGIRTPKVRECDWWDGHEHSFHDGKSDIKILCTPCQHFTGRSIHDHYKTLWASWVVETKPKEEGQKPVKIFFGGDTGYRSVPDGKDEDEMPHCPAFKEIGDKVGPFDFSMIPIGAYSPRWFMSPIHCSPEDAVRVHEDIQSKRSVGMHWGTWILTDEDMTEPPRRLQAAMAKRGHDPSVFSTVQIGETIVLDV
ncbi:hypothetical protein BGZ74_007414 [Mortierella antarctica]|nr:hypothetical protein BGZ74_007414 [Mortierella antarctica]